MGGNPLADLLSWLWRDPKVERSTLSIEVAHRGVPGDIDRLPGTEVVAAGPHGLELQDGRVVPLHRIRRLSRGDAVLYESRRQREDREWGDDSSRHAP